MFKSIAKDSPPVRHATQARPPPKRSHQVPALDPDAFIALTEELVDEEKEAEVKQATESIAERSIETAQARGSSLFSLRVEDIEGGLLGRSLLTLVSNKGEKNSTASEGSEKKPQVSSAFPLLPAHKFSPHDVVALRPSKGPPDSPCIVQGVVFRVKDCSIIVAVDDVPDEGLDIPLRLDKLANEVTYQRLKETLGALSKAAAGMDTASHPSGSRLVEVMFGKREPAFVSPPPQWSPMNLSLDESQKRAISLALSAKDVALIHGPPGTGKTTAVIELIRQEVQRGSRVLACSASNIAVDNLVERLASTGINVVRVGHPARLLPSVIECSLESKVMESDNSSLARDIRKEIKGLNSDLMRLESWKKVERRKIRDELRLLSKEERKRQQLAVKEVINGAAVIACTLTGCLGHNLEGQVFDLCVIDEAAQALEVACWGGILKAKRCVLAGDHLQLPPTVISSTAASKGLSRTLFERLQAMHGESVAEMLTVQYRMNEKIMAWSSQELYQGRVEAHETVCSHDLYGLLEEIKALNASCSKIKGKESKPSKGSKSKGLKVEKEKDEEDKVIAVSPSSFPVLSLIDTAGCEGCEERQEEEGDSRSNLGEAKAALSHAMSLIAAGLPPASIGIITPYNAQVSLLKEMRQEKYSGLEISSVDGFQGREKEAIIISMVRSNCNATNGTKQVGFLSDQRRMNVAVTRARRHCAIVCDTETVSSDPFLQRLVKYFEEYGEYWSADELIARSQG